ncbi:hypothetical protein [Pseudactinotalea sp. HY158]|uniref:hypothetical protein n=1 Tax=Pseudactinotalea sp. HY158 TaxID=2654547 RepID=UPI00129C9CEA|nr:hypothetical protein [Pseudactinotalea sp. HY158]QGH70781.1 hypothetical protein GCE65_15715 [Pseudactinotalea sp. HY158]
MSERDLYRLVVAIAPEAAAEVSRLGSADPRLRQAVERGRDHFIEILDKSATLAGMVADAWGAVTREGEFRAYVDEWSRRFRD